MKKFFFLLILASTASMVQVKRPAPDVRNIYDPEHPGTWTFISDMRMAARAGSPSPSEVRAISGHMTALADLLHRHPVFQEPKGVKIEARASFYSLAAWWLPSGDCDTDIAGCSRFPLMAELAVTLYNFYHLSNSVPPRIITHVEDNSDALFYVNTQSRTLANGEPIGYLPDRRPFTTKPIEVGRVAGSPVYKQAKGDNDAYIFFTNGRSLWVPVSCEQVLTALIQKHEKDFAKNRTGLEKQEREWQAAMAGREKRFRELEKALEQTEEDPIKRQKTIAEARAVAEAMEKRMANSVVEARAMQDKAESIVLGPLRDQLNHMSPAERAAPAYWRKGTPGVVPADTANAREVITLNLDYFDKSRPRSDIQLLTVMLNSQREDRTGPMAVTSAVRLDEFQASADWEAIAAFVVRPD